MPPFIEINLSEEFERRRRKSMPRAQIPAALAVVIIVTIAALALFYSFVAVQAGDVGRAKSALNAIAKRVEEADAYRAQYENLRARAQALAAWHAVRVPWAARWLQIANITPETVYLTEVLIMPEDAAADQQRLVLRGRAFGAAGEGDVLRMVNNCKRAALLTNYFTSVTLASVSSAGGEKAFAIELQRGTPPP